MNWMKCLAVLSLLVASCKVAPPPDGRELEDSRDLAAFLDGEQQTLFVRAGMSDTVLGRLNARTLEKDQGYEAVVGGSVVRFHIVATPTPNVYAAGQEGMFELPKALMAKIYFNARCGQLHPGFIAQCMRTFGPHRAFGNSMTWEVKDWHSCTSGDSICVEVRKPVGWITYYPGFACDDTINVVRPIMDFRGD
ncbi:MAG TPA: hypothetical protein DCX46_12695 [Bacteroidetes bacterium]|nr:hypothetical protein [Bacteroidota bacterium]